MLQQNLPDEGGDVESPGTTCGQGYESVAEPPGGP
jgi:hypothetical protein